MSVGAGGRLGAGVRTLLGIFDDADRTQLRPDEEDGCGDDEADSGPQVRVDPAGALVDIVEKPSPDLVEAHGPDPLVSMNCLAFTPRVFEACRNIAPSARGELEIVDAIRWLVAAGERVGVPRVDGGVLDLSSRGDVESVTQALRGREVTL